MRFTACVAGLTMITLTSIAAAHEMRPALLDVREATAGEFSLLWKTPMVGGARLALEPEFSGAAQPASPITFQALPDAAVQTWTLRAEDLGGQTLLIRGLASTMTDVFVRFEFRDGSVWSERLTPQQPSAVIPVRRTARTVSAAYTRIGSGHILFGLDHFFFVLGLLLLVGDQRTLLKTVVAFAVAHSLALAIAIFGSVKVPVAPLNATIPLSILFLGAEVVRNWSGQTSLTIRKPWVAAFAFGLLHGAGFSGAFSPVGLPRAEVPLALLSFNGGLELGHVAFITLLLLLQCSLRSLQVRAPIWLARLPAYAIGSLGAFWTIERTLIMLGGIR